MNDSAEGKYAVLIGVGEGTEEGLVKKAENGETVFLSSVREPREGDIVAERKVNGTTPLYIVVSGVVRTTRFSITTIPVKGKTIRFVNEKKVFPTHY